MAANNFIGLRISDERKEIYRALADAENRSISNFIVNRVDSTITGQYPTEPTQNPTKSQIRAIKALADTLSDEQSHALAHSLYGKKSEFNKIDGETDYGSSLEEKKFYTVQSTLYRGTFWPTLESLDLKDE